MPRHQKHLIDHLLRFMRRGWIYRYIVGFLVVYIVGLGILWVLMVPVRWAFLELSSGDQLLDVSSATVDSHIGTGDDLLLTLCRSPKVRIVAINNIRTFYVDTSNEQVMQRSLADGVLYEKLSVPCTTIRIPPSQRPNKPGQYYFCQSFNFYTVFKQEKTASFCSTRFSVGAE